jgi:hypothetical protein
MTLLPVLSTQPTRLFESSGDKRSRGPTVGAKHVFHQSSRTKRTPEVTIALREHHETLMALTNSNQLGEDNTSSGGYTYGNDTIEVHEDHLEQASLSKPLAYGKGHCRK